MGSTELRSGTLPETTIAKSAQKSDRQSDLVYLLLAAELAGQRGQFDLALDNYLKAAALTRDARVAARATQIALYLKKTDQALEAVNRWRELDPTSADALRLSALLELKAGHVDTALGYMQSLLAMPDIDLESTLIEVVKVLGEEIPKETSFDFMSQLAGRFPGMAEVHFAQALLAASKGDYQMALSETERALALHPDWNRARLLQAQVMSQMGDSDAARAALQKALSKDPNNVRLRLIYSQFLAKSGDAKGAVRALEKVLAKEPGNEDARFGLGMALMDTGQLDKAKQAFLQLSDSSRWKLQSYFYLGLIEARKNRLMAAMELFDKVTEGPLAFDAQVNSVTALINLGHLSEARRRLVDVRKKFPNEALRLYLLEAELLNRKKDYGAAFDLLSEALDEMPGQVELLYTRALIAEQLDRLEVLEADLRAVLEKNPNDANALNALGYTLADRYPDRLEEAKKYLDKALELKPNEPAILDSYGWLRYRMGDVGGALEYLRRAYEAIPDPEIGAHLGEVLWELGKQAEARRVWRESYKRDPDHQDIQRVRARYPEAFR